MQVRGRKEHKNSLKDVGRENDTRAERKTSNGSPGFLKIHPVCLGIGDAIALLLETV